jgi:hypothetical protein
MPDLRIKCWALSPPGLEAIAFADQLPEDRGNPIPSTSEKATVSGFGGSTIPFLALLK